MHGSPDEWYLFILCGNTQKNPPLKQISHSAKSGFK